MEQYLLHIFSGQDSEKHLLMVIYVGNIKQLSCHDKCEWHKENEFQLLVVFRLTSASAQNLANCGFFSSPAHTPLNYCCSVVIIHICVLFFPLSQRFCKRFRVFFCDLTCSWRGEPMDRNKMTQSSRLVDFFFLFSFSLMLTRHKRSSSEGKYLPSRKTNLAEDEQDRIE